ncbi:19361_t:CDS:2, partial [Gigaspora rosea]
LDRLAVLGAIHCNMTLVIAFLAGAMPKHGHLLRAILALTILALVIPTAFKIAAAPQMTNESNSLVSNSIHINCDIQNISHYSYEYIFWNVIISVENSC